MGLWGCSGISWTICKQSTHRCRQITTPTPCGQTRPSSSEVSPSRLLSSGTHFHLTSAHCSTVADSSDLSWKLIFSDKPTTLHDSSENNCLRVKLCNCNCNLIIECNWNSCDVSLQPALAWFRRSSVVTCAVRPHHSRSRATPCAILATTSNLELRSLRSPAPADSGRHRFQPISNTSRASVSSFNMCASFFLTLDTNWWIFSHTLRKV